MPLYEFVCKKCGKEEEIIQDFNSKSPHCSQDHPPEEMVKKISRPSFLLKGEGWFKDHYGLKNSKKSDG